MPDSEVIVDEVTVVSDTDGDLVLGNTRDVTPNPFEETSVTDLELPERTVMEGANVIDYDVEYDIYPIEPEQLAPSTHNVAVPAEGTLGAYGTDGVTPVYPSDEEESGGDEESGVL